MRLLDRFLHRQSPKEARPLSTAHPKHKTYRFLPKRWFGTLSPPKERHKVQSDEILLSQCIQTALSPSNRWSMGTLPADLRTSNRPPLPSFPLSPIPENPTISRRQSRVV
ncbi:hypothetical protein PHYBLDRAFT_147644 [Phycomyces blakesleeanus NRRL 1555(-)]|uniref:Uncharacterized protein n=1 Tax=Phycomyces blakesleeanus (strain ATCC 8743b / DSM 1359 / FGSC 10004 / NBRC 33097 / NRRL 1555) TaxID=763407 RepID=A0A167LUJ9_PHYB8|nr:hypothetical protein PHYBLDRAFT_147644 [Phycomyces blakesleeanus NRRL 1555(-)]OAD71134.1 hypothetical protein PHYBLDRAFT_147644 [Phycomyces blakesleeanus NRRL 1555(-)]|eukprot:XP_018289174.1 hypothetical protein PHYBLDRAFT_147644 [Phycomyces blakesleeanus NRRL 1555(-)]